MADATSLRDTINAVLRVAQLDADNESDEFPTYEDFDEALNALAEVFALLDEVQRYEQALRSIASWESPLGVEYAAKCYSRAQKRAREALNG